MIHRISPPLWGLLISRIKNNSRCIWTLPVSLSVIFILTGLWALKFTYTKLRSKEKVFLTRGILRPFIQFFFLVNFLAKVEEYSIAKKLNSQNIIKREYQILLDWRSLLMQVKRKSILPCGGCETLTDVPVLINFYNNSNFSFLFSSMFHFIEKRVEEGMRFVKWT